VKTVPHFMSRRDFMDKQLDFYEVNADYIAYLLKNV